KAKPAEEVAAEAAPVQEKDELDLDDLDDPDAAPAEPAQEKPAEPEVAKPAEEKPAEPEVAEPAEEKPAEPEVGKPAEEKPAEPEVAKPASGKLSAKQVLEELRKSNEGRTASAKYHARRGDEAMERGRYVEAAEYYREALKNQANAEYQKKLDKARFMLNERPGEAESLAEDLFEREKVRKAQYLAEINLSMDNARKALTERRVEDALRYATLAADNIALDPEHAGEELRKQVRELLDTIRKDKRGVERARQDDQVNQASAIASKELDEERSRRKVQVQDLLRKALQAIRQGEYRKVVEICETVLKQEPENKVASFWIRSANERLLKERELKVIQDRIEARKVLEENFVEATTPYDRIFVFPEDDYWQRVRLRQKRMQPRRIEDPEPIKKIKTALETTKIDVSFEDSPLRDVVDHFRTVVGINILIDPQVDPDDESLQVSQTINQLTAMSALKLILSSKELGLTFQENTLVITSADEASEPTEFEVYNVSDLLMKIRDFAAPEIRLKSSTEDQDGAPIEFTDDSFEEEEELDPEGLIELIMESTGGDDVWDGEVNSMEHQRGQLLVNATRGLHGKVLDVLENLRQDSDLYVVIEARFIDIHDDFLEDIGVDSRQLGQVTNLGTPHGQVINGVQGGNDIGIVEGPDGVPDDVFLVQGLERWAGRVQHIVDGFTGVISGERINAAGGIGGATFQATWIEPFQVNVIIRAVQEEQNVRELTAPIVTAHNNERVYVSVVTQRAYISDYELVSGGTGFAIIEVADPVVQTFQEGVILDVDPTISHDKKYITLDVRPTLATLIGGVISTVQISLGSFTNVATQVPIGIPEISLQQSFTSVTVPNGGTVLLGGFRSLNSAKYESYLPLLGKIPLLKNLVRRKATLEERRSLVILVTARIVDLRGAEEKKFNPQ
ncbi:MAG: hypothetical protein VX496_01290, partial [Planctomycetota bacterium]|nr:hypothetical protein [Planctomycetota bacterium]